MAASVAQAQHANVVQGPPSPTPMYNDPYEPVPPPGVEQLPPVAPEVEGRGIWIEMKTLPADEAGVRKLVRSLADDNFNFLLVEVTYEGASLHPSALTQQDPRFAGTDLLHPLIDEAHRRGLEVHAWVWAIKQSRWREGDARPGGPVLAMHPEWTAINQKGLAVSPGASYYWLCPSRPASRQFVIAQLEELVHRYAVDGIHLDYIRFDRILAKGAPPPYCFCEHCRSEYRRSTGIDPMTIQPFTPEFMRWEGWRETVLSSLVAEAYYRVKTARQSVLVSAAVYPDAIAARKYFGQDWSLWATNRWLDFVTPMLYRDQTDGFVRRLQHYLASPVAQQIVLLPGVGVNEIQNRIFSHDVLIEQVIATRQSGLLGMALFSYSVMTDYFHHFLKDKAFKTPAAVPFRNLEQAAATLRSQAARVGNPGLAGRPPLPVRDSAREANWLLARAAELESIARFRNSDLPTQPPTAPPIPVVTAYRPPPSISIPTISPSNAPRIDGSISDKIWKKLGAVHLSLDENGSRGARKTWARLATDGTYLYVAFHCDEPDMEAVVARANRPVKSIYDVDNVAVFLDPGPSRSQYLVLAVDPFARRQFEKVPDPRLRPRSVGTSENVPSSLEWRAGARRGKKFWNAEMAIPLRELDLGRDVRTLGLNLQRTHRAQTRRMYMQWSPTYGQFYQPSRFGTASLP